MAGPIWAKWVRTLLIKLLSSIHATMVTKSSATWSEQPNFLMWMNDVPPINRGYQCTCGINERNCQPPQFRILKAKGRLAFTTFTFLDSWPLDYVLAAYERHHRRIGRKVCLCRKPLKPWSFQKRPT